MDAAKLQLSQDEIGLINNTEWILTKHSIIKKVCLLLGEINEIMKEEVLPFDYLFPPNVKLKQGKISRGENYGLLPYVILDYPSFFEKENIFAIRSMFWWGNFFSITLHLSGQYKTEFINHNPELINFLQVNNFFICTGADEWQHHFNEDNYTLSSDVSLTQFEELGNKSFFKIAKKLSLAKWDNALIFFNEGLLEIIKFLQINFPAGKKDL